MRRRSKNKAQDSSTPTTIAESHDVDDANKDVDAKLKISSKEVDEKRQQVKSMTMTFACPSNGPILPKNPFLFTILRFRR